MTQPCNKEKEINEIRQKLDKLNTVIFEDTNGDSLYAMTKQNHEYLKETHGEVKNLNSNVNALMIFQAQVEKAEEIKQRLHERRERRQMWLIGLLIGTAVSLVAILIRVL
jgi:nitrate reductase NapAB chaperone NapD